MSGICITALPMYSTKIIIVTMKALFIAAGAERNSDAYTNGNLTK